jgi:Cytidylate kinase-like family
VSYRVVCISSEDGAAAPETAPLVAEALSFRLIDEQILTRAAVEAGVDKEVVADVEKRKSRLVRLVEGLGPAGMAAGPVVSAESLGYGQPASDELRGLIRAVIEDTATSGEVVLVSHAASLALGGRDDVLRVLVTAPTSTRQRRLASTLGVDEKEADRVMKRSDAGRADYIKRFYGVGAELPSHYDLVINTDRITPDAVARLIVDAAKRSA